MADNIKYEDFLGATGYKTSKAPIKVFDSKDLKDSVEFNLQGATITKIDAIDNLTAASSLTDGSIAPQTPSYQPQNEAGLAVSGTSLETSAMGASVSNAVSIQDKSVEFIKNSGMLSPDFYDVTNFTTELIKDGNKLLSTGAMSLANSSEKANGSILFNSATDFKIGGSNIYFGSEGTIHETSAIKSSVHNNSTTQAKTHNVIADVKTENLKHKIKNIEGSDHTVAKNIQTTATGSDRKYGKSMSATASEDYKVAGKSISNYADDIAETHSKNTIYQTAQSNFVSQAGDISITANSSTITPPGSNPTAADGDVGDRLTKALEGGSTGCINILAQGDLSSYGEKVINTSVASTYNFSGKDTTTYAQKIVSSALDILSGASKNNTVFGAKNASLQTLATSITLSKVIRVGRSISLRRILPNILNFLPKVVTIPPLPTLPGGVSNASLESCIPDKFKPPKDESEDITSTNDNSSSSSKPKPSDIPREKKTPIPTTKTQTRIPTTTAGSGNSAGGVGTSTGTGGKAGEVLGDLQAGDPINDAITRANKSTGEALKGPTNNEGSKSGPSSATASNTSALAQDKPQGVGNAAIAANGVFRGGIDIFSPEIESGSPTAFDLSEPEPEKPDDEVFKVTCAQVADLMTDSFIVQVAAKNGLDPNFLLPLNNYFEAFCEIDPEVLVQLTESDIINSKEFKELEKDSEVKLLLKEMIANGNITLLVKCLEEVYSLVAIGGLLELASGALKGVSSALNVVKSISQETVNPLTIFNEITNIPLVSNIVSSNSTLSTLVSLGKSFTSGSPEEINQQIQDFATKAVTTQLDEVLSKLDIPGLDSKGIETIGNIFKQIESGQSLTQETIDGLINQVSGVIGNNDINKAIDIYKQVSPIVQQISSGNIDSLLKGEGLDQVLSLVLGSGNAGILDKATDIYSKGKSLYETVSSIPSLINLMNDYEIPLLNQINVALNCLDLMNQVSDLIAAIGGLSEDSDNEDNGTSEEDEGIDKEIPIAKSSSVTREETIKVLEDLPRLIQIYNSIQDAPVQAFTNTVNVAGTFGTNNLVIDNASTFDGTINNNNSSNNNNFIISNSNKLSIGDTTGGGTSVDESRIGRFINNNIITSQEVKQLKELVINEANTNCYVIPKLNYLEASIRITEISNGKLLFNLITPKLLDLNSKRIYPSIGDVIQLRVKSFINNKTGEILEVHRSAEYFSPYVYSFTIMDYLKPENIGLAGLIFNYNRIYLTNNNHVIYEYDVQDIGGRLTPIIEDSYLLL